MLLPMADRKPWLACSPPAAKEKAERSSRDRLPLDVPSSPFFPRHLVLLASQQRWPLASSCSRSTDQSRNSQETPRTVHLDPPLFSPRAKPLLARLRLDSHPILRSIETVGRSATIMIAAREVMLQSLSPYMRLPIHHLGMAEVGLEVDDGSEEGVGLGGEGGGGGGAERCEGERVSARRGIGRRERGRGRGGGGYKTRGTVDGGGRCEGGGLSAVSVSVGAVEARTSAKRRRWLLDPSLDDDGFVERHHGRRRGGPDDFRRDRRTRRARARQTRLLDVTSSVPPILLPPSQPTLAPLGIETHNPKRRAVRTEKPLLGVRMAKDELAALHGSPDGGFPHGGQGRLGRGGGGTRSCDEGDELHETGDHLWHTTARGTGWPPVGGRASETRRRSPVPGRENAQGLQGRSGQDDGWRREENDAERVQWECPASGKDDEQELNGGQQWTWNLACKRDLGDVLENFMMVIEWDEKESCPRGCTRERDECVRVG
ncbi:hypothetical protein BJ875DRAFT_200459 [Amylocarpus encephaloides]|uniref:Uncharacterized protein n=1 Tax=Amylocarpus encephaloides TaxID=45428 RepID=A0A9P7Y959_9HELO|nr:hypothetical protein BJ875DRAFT_200459 [Amylocarpus encephaloides]